RIRVGRCGVAPMTALRAALVAALLLLSVGCSDSTHGVAVTAAPSTPSPSATVAVPAPAAPDATPTATATAPLPPAAAARPPAPAAAVAVVCEPERLLGHGRREDGGDQVDEVAHEQAVIGVRSGARPTSQLAGGQAHGREAPVEADGVLAEEGLHQRAPALDA